MAERKPPPLGIMPRFIWIEKRQDELLAMANRYKEDNEGLPASWLEEFNLNAHELNRLTRKPL